MATFYIQLENRLLQISGELTAENISKALGYVPVSPNVTNELSQRVDNITFDSLKDNPFLQDGSGELNIVDEAGNIIAKIDANGIHSVDFIAGEHRLSNKTDKTYVDEAVKNVKVDLTGYATEEYVNNIDFYNINNNPIVNNGDGKLLFVDENGYIGLQLEEDGLYVKDVIADGHTLSQKADKSEVPTSTSQLTNDSGYITKPVVDQAIASLVDSAPETLDTIGEIASALKNNADIVDVLNQSISDKQNTIEDLEAIRTGAALGATALQEIPEEYVTRDEIPSLPSLDEYAKKEDIPSLNGYATQAWVNNKNYATEEDLSSIEFNSLQNNPLVEDSNGEFNLVDDLGNVGFKVNEEGLFVKNVIAGNHVLSNKQDTLVSGTNVKTINGTSILGSGDITIGGGSSSGSGAYSEVNHGTADTTFTLTPNTFHVWDEVASLTLDFGSETSGVANEYLFQFTSGATATTLTLPNDFKWANDTPPTIESNMIYQVSILKGLASVLEFSNAVKKRENLIDGQYGTYLISAQYPVASDITIEYWDKFGDDIYTVTMLAGTSEVSTPEKFGYIENLSPKEDDQFYYLYTN